MRNTNIKTLDKYTAFRSVWMGFSALWIVFFHSEFVFNSSILTLIRDAGYGGVDILIFSSGLGYYHSLSTDPNMLDFYKRRIRKVFPIYLVSIIIWLITRLISGIPIHFKAIIGNIFMVQFFTGLGNYFNWFFALYLLQLLVAPLFSEIAKKASIPQCFVFFFVLLLNTVPFWGAKDIIVAIICRMPIFFLGMIFEKNIDNKDFSTKHNKTIITIIISAFVIGIYLLYLVFRDYAKTEYQWCWGFAYYPYLLIIPGLCISLSIISDLLTRISLGKIAIRILSWIGNMSLEVFIAHSIVYQFLYYWLNTNIKWFIGIILSLFAAYIIKLFSQLTRKLFFNKSK